MKRLHLAVIAVVVGATLVIAGATLIAKSDSFPKKAVLKAQDMGSIIDLHGNWTQELLDTYDNSSSPPYGAKHAAQSHVVLKNATGSIGFGFMVAEMSSTEQAEEQYYGLISTPNFQNKSYWVQTSLDPIGDEAVMFTSPPTLPIGGCWIIFQKGVYLVTMLGAMDTTECQSIMLKLAEAQADRLP